MNAKNDDSSDDNLMNKIVNDESYKTNVEITEATRVILNEMPNLSGTNQAKLNKLVADKLNLTVTRVAPFVHMEAQTHDGISIRRGRYGGIFKGLVEKEPDVRPRCGTCNQVKRQPRKKNEAKTLSGSEQSLENEDDSQDDCDQDDDSPDNDQASTN